MTYDMGDLTLKICHEACAGLDVIFEYHEPQSDQTLWHFTPHGYCSIHRADRGFGFTANGYRQLHITVWMDRECDLVIQNNISAKTCRFLLADAGLVASVRKIVTSVSIPRKP